MSDLKLMLLISFACLQLTEWSGVVQKFKWWLTWDRRIKPFDCAYCLTLWVSLAIFIYLDYKWWAILYAFANSGLAVLINNIHERITKK